MGAISTLVVIVALAAGSRPYLSVATVAACAALIAGILVGSSFGSSARLGGWAAAYATPAPTAGWVMPSFPTYLEAPGDVTIELDAASGFVSVPPTRGPDGTFGHWCHSGPDSTVVAEVAAGDVARSGASTIYAELHLRDLALIDQEPPVTYPRLVLQLGGPSGFTEYAWAGSARVVALDGPAGTVAFDALVADPAPPGLPRVLSGQLSWSCRPWSTP